MRVASAVLALITAGGLLAGCELTASPDGCAPGQGSAPAGPPTRLAINHDDFDAKHVGRTADGQQFFLTEPFDIGPEGGTARLFVALYVSAGTGRFLDAEIDAFDEVPGHSAGLSPERPRLRTTSGGSPLSPVTTWPSRHRGTAANTTPSPIAGVEQGGPGDGCTGQRAVEAEVVNVINATPEAGRTGVMLVAVAPARYL